MPEYPLLVFPQPDRAERAKRNPGRGRLRVPTPSEQARRLTPQFERLQQALEQRRIILQDNSFGIQPEQVLVFETFGPVERFINAVRKIHGLEWMAELELDELEPKHGFEDVKKPEKLLRGQLFVVMTDQTALNQLRSLFEKWKQNPDMQFERGLAPLREAFKYLHTIRPWDAEDRVRDTGVLEDWEERAAVGQEVVPFEAELWFREDPQRRRQAQAYLSDQIEALGGQIVQHCTIPEIAYHAILGDIPIKVASELLSGTKGLEELRLLKCEDIMYLRPVGQCAVRQPEDLSETEPLEQGKAPAPSQDEPVVALLNGMPLTKHKLLDGRLVVDDPDGYERAYQADQRVHGSAMASLICHGDANENGQPVNRTAYVRPILQPHRSLHDDVEECIPDKVLPVDLVHRAVRRMFEGEGTETPTAPGVRVINLSVGDRSRPLDRSMSSWARLVDWLSWKYDVLFIVSAGNHGKNIELDVPKQEFRGLSAEEREIAVMKAIAADTRHRRLLSPAETFNGVTVGATHHDNSPPLPQPRLIDPFARAGLPSTYSAHGPGYRRTIKPELLLPGGKQLLAEQLGASQDNAILESMYFVRPPGQRTAAPGASGELNRTNYTRGTSNAAALATRYASFLYGLIGQLRSQQGANLSPDYDAVLIKALLVHGTDWSEIKPAYEAALRDERNNTAFREYIARFVGYGPANVPKVMACTDQRVTVVGVGSLNNGEAELFQLPLPPSLSAVTKKRRLKISLAWLTPVSNTRQNYRIAQLWFNPKNQLTPDRSDAGHDAVQRGTVQHEVLKGHKAVDYQDGDAMEIKVNCRADAAETTPPIRYALAVTLEIPESVNISIYQEVQQRLRVRVPAQSGRV